MLIPTSNTAIVMEPVSDHAQAKRLLAVMAMFLRLHDSFLMRPSGVEECSRPSAQNSLHT